MTQKLSIIIMLQPMHGCFGPQSIGMPISLNCIFMKAYCQWCITFKMHNEKVYSTYINCEGGDQEVKRRLQEEERNEQTRSSSTVITGSPVKSDRDSDLRVKEVGWPNDKSFFHMYKSRNLYGDRMLGQIPLNKDYFYPT